MAIIKNLGKSQMGTLPGFRQNANASADSFGAQEARAQQGLGKAVQQVGNTTFDIFKKQQMNEDLAVSKDAYNRANKAVSEMIQSGVKSKKGLNASNVATESEQSMDTIYQDITSEMTNEQKDLFKPRWDALQNSSMNSVRSYRTGQINSAHESSDVAAVENSMTNIKNAYDDPNVIDHNSQIAVMALRSRADRNGWPKEQVDREMDILNSRIHTGVIEGALDGKRQGLAERYYKQYKKEINPDVRKALEKRIEAEGIIERSQSETDILVAKHGVDGEAAALEEAHKKNKGEMEDAVVRRIQSRYTDSRRAKQQAQATQIYDQSTSLGSAKTEAEKDSIIDAVKDPVVKTALIRYRAIIAPKTTSSTAAGLPEVIASNSRTEDVMRAIDSGVIPNKQALRAVVISQGVTKAESKKLDDYYDQDGMVGGFNITTIDTLIGKQVDGKTTKDYPYILEALKDQFLEIEGDAKVTSERLNKALSYLLMEGETKDEGYFVFGRGYDKKMYDAYEEGRTDWMPDISSDDKKKLTLRIEAGNARRVARGEQPVDINDENLRKLKKALMKSFKWTP